MRFATGITSPLPDSGLGPHRPKNGPDTATGSTPGRRALALIPRFVGDESCPLAGSRWGQHEVGS